MRTVIPLLLAAFLVTPPALALGRGPELHGDQPAGARAQLTPPQPGKQTWPSGANRGVPFPAPSPAQTTGTVRVLVLLVDFQDVPPGAAHTGAYFDSFYNNASAGAKSFRAYYTEVSLGALTVQATVIPTWFHSAYPMWYYGADGSRPPDDANGPIYRLVTETVRLPAAPANLAALDAKGGGGGGPPTGIPAGGGPESGGRPRPNMAPRRGAPPPGPAPPAPPAAPPR